ncbi:hypothetical protein [Corynebacterium casei]|uniref:hypothetical protein n=1 Tax=Corynebacterium casei TaxID=160386 RepID=UPI003F93363B
MSLGDFNISPETQAKLDSGELTIDGLSFRSTTTNKYSDYAPYVGSSLEFELDYPAEPLDDGDGEAGDAPTLGEVLVQIAAAAALVGVVKGAYVVKNNAPRWIESIKQKRSKKQSEESAPKAIESKPVVDHAIVYGLNPDKESDQELTDDTNVPDEQQNP